MTERSPEDVVTGILRLSVGGVVRIMPTLKAKYIDAWATLLGSPGGEMKPLAEWTMQDVASLSGHATGRLVDLVVAYDRTGALGGREWLEENADPAELNAALVEMVGNAFPLRVDPVGLVRLVLAQAAVQSVPPSSTNGASPTGTSTRKRSGRASTPSK